MAKLELETNYESSSVYIDKLIIGHVYWSDELETYVLRIHNCIVDLCNPEYTYASSTPRGLFYPVKSAKLIIER